MTSAPSSTPGMPAPGCVPPPTKYSPRSAPVAVGRAQPGGLLQRRLDGERVAPRRAEVALEVVGRHPVLDDDRRRRARRGRTSSRGPRRARRAGGRTRASQSIRRRRWLGTGSSTHSESPPGGAIAGLRCARARARRSRTSARSAAARDVADEAPVAAADEQRVVQQRVERAVGAEVQQEARHRRRQAPQRRARGRAARACAGRRRWRRRRRRRSARRPRARRPSPRPARCSMRSTRAPQRTSSPRAIASTIA